MIVSTAVLMYKCIFVLLAEKNNGLILILYTNYQVISNYVAVIHNTIIEEQGTFIIV